MLKRAMVSLSSGGLVVLCAIGAGSLGGAGCGGGSGGSGGGSGGGGGGTSIDTTCNADAGTVTTTQLFAGVAGMKCKECHFPASGGMAAGSGFAYGDYTNLDNFHAATVNANSKYAGSNATLKVIDPKNLANSSMWLKLHGGSPKVKGPKNENVGGAMPNDGTMLSDAEIAQFKAWICSGANK